MNKTKDVDLITMNLGKDAVAEIKRRAESMHIAKSKYCQIIIKDWLKSGKKLTLGEK